MYPHQCQSADGSRRDSAPSFTRVGSTYGHAHWLVVFANRGPHSREVTNETRIVLAAPTTADLSCDSGVSIMNKLNPTLKKQETSEAHPCPLLIFLVLDRIFDTCEGGTGAPPAMTPFNEARRSGLKDGCSIKSCTMVGTPVKRVTFSCSMMSSATPASHFFIMITFAPAGIENKPTAHKPASVFVRMFVRVFVRARVCACVRCAVCVCAYASACGQRGMRCYMLYANVGRYVSSRNPCWQTRTSDSTTSSHMNNLTKSSSRSRSSGRRW
jgi:hypothetical protein